MTALSAGQKDAFVTASWLKGADDSRELTDLLQPALSKPERSASRAQQLNAGGCTAVHAIAGVANFRLAREVSVGGIDNTIRCCHHIQQ